MIRGKVGYALRETLHNLRRHLVLTTASMLTVAISLSLVGVAFMIRSGVSNQTSRWEGGIEFEVFLKPAASPEQVDYVQGQLEDSPDVLRIEYVDQQRQYELFRLIFANEPAYLENVTAEILPPSFRVEPAVADADVIQTLVDRMGTEPGVEKVAYAGEKVRDLLRTSQISQLVILIVASVLLFAASLLIFNTIRMAIFARRREIEVMKLVGATNWFIRVPFMIEGLLQGVVGAGAAFGLVYAVRRPLEEGLRTLPLFEQFVILSNQVTFVGIVVLIVGAGAGAVGAGVAVTKFLDV